MNLPKFRRISIRKSQGNLCPHLLKIGSQYGQRLENEPESGSEVKTSEWTISWEVDDPIELMDLLQHATMNAARKKTSKEDSEYFHYLQNQWTTASDQKRSSPMLKRFARVIHLAI